MFLILFSFLTFEFSNGLKVFYEKRENTKVFTFLILVNSGSFNEEKGNEGLTHFLEHMLFDGNERFSREELRKNFDKLGLYVNAFTREDYTAYFFSGPDKSWKEGVYLLYLMLFKSTFPDKEFAKEKEVVIQEMIQDRAREFNVVKEKVDSIIYQGTNYSHPVIGYERTIKNLKKERLIKFYKKFYVPNNMIILAKGDIDERKFVDFLKKVYGKEKPREITIKENTAIQKFLNEKIFFKIPDLKNSYIFVAYNSVPLNHPSSPYFIILEELLNSDKGLKKFVQENKKVMNAGFSYETKRKFGISLFKITLKKFNNFDSLFIYEVKLKEFVIEFLKNLKKSDFKKIKNKILSRKIYEDLDPVYSIFYETDYLIYDDPFIKEKIYSQIKNINFESFSDFWKEVFKNKRTIFVINKPEEEKKAEIFPEAIHILLKKRIFYEPKGKNGLSQVFFRAIWNEKIKDKTDSLGLKIKSCDNPYIPFDDYYHRRDFAYIRIVFPSDKRKDVLDILGEILNPEIDSFSFNKAKKEAIFVKNLAENDPRQEAWDEFEKRIFKERLKRSLYGEIDEIESITPDDLYGYAKNIFKKENIIITYESSKKDKNFEKELLKFSENRKGRTLEFNNTIFNDTIYTDRLQSYIIGGRIFKFEKREDVLKYIALALILSDKMQEGIRERLGLSYRLYSGIKIFPGYLIFYFEIGTSKQGIDRVINALKKEFNNIKRRINKDEFEIAINSFIGNMSRRLENPETRSFYEGFYIYTGLGEDFDEFLLNNFKNIKSKDIKLLANKILDFDKFSKVYLIGK